MMSDGRLKSHAVPCGDGQIGILNLPSFYEGSHASSADGDMREAIQKLKRQAPLKGIILDLRENAGGFLTQAVKISGLFITKGVVVISKYSRGEIKIPAQYRRAPPLRWSPDHSHLSSISFRS